MQSKVVILLLILLIGIMQAFIPPGTLIRHNGTEWIDFGPAIIITAQAIEISLSNNSKPPTTSIIKSQEDMKKIKLWILENFRDKLNFSPNDPRYEAVEFSNSITLYSTREMGNDDILLNIPLNKLTLGQNEQEYKKQLEKLRMLLSVK